MAEAKVQRRLAAILAADVVGYSQLIRADEEGTLERFKGLHNELIDPLLAEHGGRTVKLMGDGILVEFASVVSAVRAAAQIQRAIAEANTDLPEHERIEFRMGINLGDVVIDGDDIHGDGVNVAARLEGVAEPGGICISESVYEQVRDRVDLAFTDSGERQVKNIDRPIRIYAWRPGVSLPATPSPVPAADKPSDKPTVALAAFEVVGRNEDAEALATAVTDAVTSALSNQTGLSLLGDSAQADYLAQGSIQAAGSRYRATVQVLDRRSGEQFASDRFDSDLSDPFEAQDELAYHVATAVRFAVTRRQFERAASSAAAPDTTDAILTKAGYLTLSSKRADWQQGLELANQIVAREPDNFMALAIKALAHLADAIVGYRDVSAEDGAAALAAARRAVALNEHSDFAHTAKGLVHLIYEGDLAASRRENERALELSPYYPVALHNLGLTLIYDGDAESGIALCQKAVEANPRLPLNYGFMVSLAIGHFILERDTEAVEWAQRSDQQAADAIPALLILAAAAHHAGQAQLAAETAARLLAVAPDFTIGGLRRLPFRNAAHWQRFVAGLRGAGLPD